MSRSIGLKRDLRLNKLETYANYYYLNFRSYLGNHGDCYDRFLLRMAEMAESVNITNQVINKLTNFNHTPQNILKNKNSKLTNLNPHNLTNFLSKNILNKVNYTNPYTSMEHLIKHFKF